jgi:hypothetical protein
MRLEANLARNSDKTDQVPMFSDLPMDNPDAKKSEPCNILQDQFIYLLDRDKVELAEVQKQTGIAFTTLYDWYRGNVSTQKADKNLLTLARYFKVTLEFLCFGIGDDNPFYETFEDETNKQKGAE